MLVSIHRAFERLFSLQPELGRHKWIKSHVSYSWALFKTQHSCVTPIIRRYVPQYGHDHMCSVIRVYVPSYIQVPVYSQCLLTLSAYMDVPSIHVDIWMLRRAFQE